MRILLCGLGTFILTLAFSFWHDWRHDAAPVTRAAPQPHKDSLVPAGAVASNPLGPPPAIAPPEAVQSDPYSTPDVDDGTTLARRDRGAERGSRSH
jgi:hypothetical protein